MGQQQGAFGFALSKCALRWSGAAKPDPAITNKIMDRCPESTPIGPKGGCALEVLEMMGDFV